MAIAGFEEPPKYVLIICDVRKPRIALHILIKFTDAIWNLLIPYWNASISDRFDEVVRRRYKLRIADGS